MSRSNATEPSLDTSLQGLQLVDYLEILRRRKLWILMTALGVFVMGVVVAVRLPSVYHSETVIVVDAQQVPDSIVQSTVTSSVMDRLSTIRQLVLSPTRLSGLIFQLNLFSDARQKQQDQQQLVAGMQKAITIEIAESGSQRLGAFKIGYSSRDSREAAQVANALADMVIRESLKARERQFTGNEEFLQNELEETKRKLEAKEAEVSRIRAQYIQDLPESKQYHIEQLDSLRGQLRSSQDRTNRAQQEKVYLQSMLVSSHPVIDLDPTNDAGPSGAQIQIEKLESSLAEMRARYGPGYPDVKKLQSQLNALKARKSQEDEDKPKRDVIPQTVRAAKNPVIESQLAKLDQEISEQAKLQAQLNEQISFHVSKLEQIPVFEGRIAGLMRDYESLRAHYNRLLDRQLSAEMASNLEVHQKSERFQTLDAATVPDKPAAPNRKLIALGALFGGLFVGLVVAVIVDLSDTAVRSEKEAARILGAPVLAGIPLIVSPQQERIRRLRIATAAALVAVCSAGVGFLITSVPAWIS